MTPMAETAPGRARDPSRLFADLVEVLEPTPDPATVAARAQRFLREALAIDHAGIYLAGAEGDLVLVEATTRCEQGLPEIRVPATAPTLVRLRAQRSPLRVPVEEHPNPHGARNLAERGVRRVVLTPLVAGERLLGLLSCSREGEDALGDIPDDLFRAVGRMVGVALEQARLLAEGRARADGDRSLLEAARLAAMGADMDAVLGKYAEALARVAGARLSTITLANTDGATLSAAATFGWSDDDRRLMARNPLLRGDPVIERAFATRRLVRVEKAEGANAAGHELLARYGLVHFFCLPLVVGEAVIGIAFLAGVAAIGPDRENGVEAVGHEIAVAIEAASERKRARHRFELVDLGEELRHSVRVSFDVNAFLQDAVERIGRTLGAARCYAGFKVPSQQTLRITNEWRSSDALPSALEWKLDGADRPIRRAMEKTGCVVCDDVLADARFGSIEANAPGDLRSFIVARFVEGPSIYGFIAVGETARPRPWREEEVRLICAAAENCAIAVRRAEIHEDAQRRASELELTISQMVDGVVVTDERLEAIRANDAARAIFWGLPVSRELLGQVEVYDLDGRRLAGDDDPIVSALTKGETIRDREVVIRNAGDGRRRSVVASASPIRDASGRLVGGVIVLRDVTEARAAAAHASRTEKLRVVGELAASVAHDINNTLAAVLGCAELIAAIGEGGEVVRNAAVIAQAARDASVILGRLTRLSQRTHAAARDAVDLVHVADDAIELTRARWGRPGSGIVAVLERDGHVVVRGVAAELREVLTNLILNATDALPRGGRIRVRVGLERERALLEVQDDGVGMPEDVLRHAFEPFFTTKGDSGTGLGLSISSAIVAGHGGTIDAESKPGEGTTIRVRLPLAASAPSRSPGAIARKRVLVVDDDARVRSLLASLLATDGHAVVAAASGEEALELLAREGDALDLVVTDYLMPGMSGLEVARAARARSARIGLVVVSGFCGDETAAALERLGARVVTKPFGAEDIRAAVAAALGAPATA
jgi:PAS domain S-box-containing protein